jgi:hypothetical protein
MNRDDFTPLSAVPPTVIDLGDGRELVISRWRPQWREGYVPDNHCEADLSGLVRKKRQKADDKVPLPEELPFYHVVTDPALLNVRQQDQGQGLAQAVIVMVMEDESRPPGSPVLVLTKSAALELAEMLRRQAGSMR